MIKKKRSCIKSALEGGGEEEWLVAAVEGAEEGAGAVAAHAESGCAHQILRPLGAALQQHIAGGTVAPKLEGGHALWVREAEVLLRDQHILCHAALLLCGRSHVPPCERINIRHSTSAALIKHATKKRRRVRIGLT